MKIIRMIILTLLLAGNSQTWSGFDEGLAAIKAGDYAIALREWRPLAEQGDAKAQFNLGFLYLVGIGVYEDDKGAAKWLRKAAEQGQAEAQLYLGRLYDSGDAKDYEEAERWFRKAAEQNNAEALYELGLMYSGYPKYDEKEATKWFIMAAEQGLPVAQTNLGDMYLNGKRVQRNHKEAVKWYMKAAEQGDYTGQYKLGQFYHNGSAGIEQDYIQAYKWYILANAHGSQHAKSMLSFVIRKMTPAQITEAQELAREWLENHPHSHDWMEEWPPRW